MLGLRLLLLLCFLMLPTSIHAQSSHSWQVQKVTGVAYIAQKGKKAQRVKRGMFLNPGQTLSTRTRSRLLMVRGKERMQVGPGAIMAIPPSRYNKRGKTVILHQSGRLDLSVNKKNVRHFSVKTPYLTAVVKGTTFTVDVQSGRSKVSVSSGSVQVSDNSSGDTADITRGQSISVKQTSAGKSRMTVQAGPKPVKVIKVRKNKQKPNFYATVKVKNRTVALSPGSVSSTAPIESVRNAMTSASSSVGTRSNSVSTRTSNSGRSFLSPSGSYDMTADQETHEQSGGSDSSGSASDASPGNSNGAGNSSNSNANSNATNNSNAGGNNGNSNSSNTSSSRSSPGNSNGEGNSSNSNANSNATNNPNAGGNNGNGNN